MAFVERVRERTSADSAGLTDVRVTDSWREHHTAEIINHMQKQAHLRHTIAELPLYTLYETRSSEIRNVSLSAIAANPIQSARGVDFMTFATLITIVNKLS